MTVGDSLFTLLDDVWLLEFQWIHSQMGCNVVHMGLHGKDRLRSTEASEGAGREGVSSDAFSHKMCIWNVVYTVGVEDSSLKDYE